MKKILACAICLFSIAATHTVFAASNPTGYSLGPIDLTANVTSTNPQLTIQLSSNVLLNYGSTASTGLYYALGSYHNKGGRTYTSTSNDAKIFYVDSTATAYIGIPTTSASSAQGSWLSL